MALIQVIPWIPTQSEGTKKLKMRDRNQNVSLSSTTPRPYRKRGPGVGGVLPEVFHLVPFLALLHFCSVEWDKYQPCQPLGWCKWCLLSPLFRNGTPKLRHRFLTGTRDGADTHHSMVSIPSQKISENSKCGTEIKISRSPPQQLVADEGQIWEIGLKMKVIRPPTPRPRRRRPDLGDLFKNPPTPRRRIARKKESPRIGCTSTTLQTLHVLCIYLRILKLHHRFLTRTRDGGEIHHSMDSNRARRYQKIENAGPESKYLAPLHKNPSRKMMSMSHDLLSATLNKMRPPSRPRPLRKPGGASSASSPAASAGVKPSSRESMFAFRFGSVFA